MISGKKDFLKNKKIIAIIIAVILIILFFIFIVNKPSPVPKPISPVVSMPFDINYWLFKEGYTTPVITIKNLGDIDWKNCGMDINKTYKVRLTEFPAVSPEENIQIIPIINFIKDDGTAFDYEIESIKSICISCVKPFYKSYCGKF